MKEGLFCGLVAGIIVGAMLYKHSDDAKQVIDKGEEMAKKEIDNLKKSANKS